jgi:hypothetical protein
MYEHVLTPEVERWLAEHRRTTPPLTDEQRAALGAIVAKAILRKQHSAADRSRRKRVA